MTHADITEQLAVTKTLGRGLGGGRPGGGGSSQHCDTEAEAGEEGTRKRPRWRGAGSHTEKVGL